MKSIFNPDDNRELINRVQTLTPDVKPVWGKMTAAQMVLHAQAPFKVALKELQLKRGIVGILFGSMAKKKLVGPEPFGKNLPTAPAFKVTTHPEFEKEKQNLIDFLHRIIKAGPSGITKEPHPFFGKMTSQEWDILLFKHMDHHLRQFGK